MHNQSLYFQHFINLILKFLLKYLYFKLPVSLISCILEAELNQTQKLKQELKTLSSEDEDKLKTFLDDIREQNVLN
ncbi:MAG: hypothetical protein Q8870_02440, partial [Sweet potato little leaf phytoplasma]|nr:hypothetical protein [Sweet potato little leaf phytoplasma]